MESSVLVLDYLTGILLSLKARKSFIFVLEPSIAWGTEFADWVNFSHVLAVPHGALHLHCS